MLGFGRGWRRRLLGLYRAALLHTSISSDSYPLLAVPLTRLLFPSSPRLRHSWPSTPSTPFQPSLPLPPSPPSPAVCLPPRPLHPSFATHLPKPRLSSATPSRHFSSPSQLRQTLSRVLSLSFFPVLPLRPQLSLSRPLPRKRSHRQTNRRHFAVLRNRKFLRLFTRSTLVRILLRTGADINRTGSLRRVVMCRIINTREKTNQLPGNPVKLSSLLPPRRRFCFSRVATTSNIAPLFSRWTLNFN